MKSITIHNIDPLLSQKITEKCQETGMSQNKTIKLLLKKSLLKDKKESRIETFREFFGSWSKDELEEFEEATKDMSQIHSEDWE